MTHVSKRPIDHGVHERILGAFIEGVTSPNITERRHILRALLTRTEKTMLAKRLAIIVMLSNGDTYDMIANALNVSKSTILRLHRHLEAGTFNAIQRSFKRQTGWESFHAALELHLAGPMPSIAGLKGEARLRKLRIGRKLSL